MATRYDANEIGPHTIPGSKRLWAYNALDVLLTGEIYNTLQSKVAKYAPTIYEFQRGMMSPALALMERGLRVDHDRIRELAAEYKPLLYSLTGMERDAKGKWKITDKNALIQQLALAASGRTLNVNSPKQLIELFYKDLLIPEQTEYKKGKQSISCGRPALEKISKLYPRGSSIARCILKVRDMEKALSVLETKLSEDGRLRCSYNICGTETGRWSSSASAFWDGTNLQNITKDLRAIIIPDPGYRMFYIDLKSAESYAVAYLSQDEAYIKACTDGDIHTAVAKLIWRNAGWSGNLATDKELAENMIIYRDYSARFMCKKLGHGTSYGGTPRTLAQQANVEEWLVKVFQAQYFGGDLYVDDLIRWGRKDLVEEYEILGNHRKYIRLPGSFPGIKKWQEDTITTIQTDGILATPFGRRRQFWGRPYDTSTWREAIAFGPQSIVGDLLNWGLFNLHTLEKTGSGIHILSQCHDAVLGQVPIGMEQKLEPLIIEALVNPVEIHGRTMLIPATIKWGNNWKEVS